MGLLSHFILYGRAVGAHWVAVVAGGLFVMSDWSDKLLPKWKGWADHLGFTAPRRRVAQVTILILSLGWAGFAAWEDEYAALQGALTKLSDSNQRAAYWQGRASAPRVERVVTAARSRAPPMDTAAGPRSGPIGPIAGVELAQLFASAPRPCTVQVTAPEENKNLRETIKWIIQYGGSCAIASAPPVPDISQPEPRPLHIPGVIVHYAAGNEFGERVVRFFVAMNMRAAKSADATPNAQVWIDIGPGSPWRS